MKRGTAQHPKMLMLVSMLQEMEIPSALSFAVGCLELLWHWCARYAIRGDIGKWSNLVIVRSIGWEGDPDTLINALVQSGWLDEVDGPARLVVHDIQDHADNAWRQNLVDAGLKWWDGSSPRGKVGRPRGSGKKTPEKLQKNSSRSPAKLSENFAKTPQPGACSQEPVASSQEPSTAARATHRQGAGMEHAGAIAAAALSKIEKQETPAAALSPEDLAKISDAVTAATNGVPEWDAVKKIGEHLARQRIPVREYLSDFVTRWKRMPEVPRNPAGWMISHAEHFRERTDGAR